MTAKEKAKELIEKAKKTSSYQYQEYAGAHYSLFEHDIDTLKLIALITVDEIISEFEWLNNFEDKDRVVFWQEVKQEIQKL